MAVEEVTMLLIYHVCLVNQGMNDEMEKCKAILKCGRGFHMYSFFGEYFICILLCIYIANDIASNGNPCHSYANK